MSENINTANKRLAIGTIVYMIGNVSSKILQMLILPIITKALSTGEYGTYDLIITTISLISPIVTCQLIEGMFRFLFDCSEEEKSKTISSVSAFIIAGSVLLGFAVCLTHSFLTNYGNPLLIYLNFLAYVFLNYTQKLARCQSKNKQFAVSGVVNTIVILGLQALFLLVFNSGLNGMILATCISHFTAGLYLCFYLKVKNHLSISFVDVKTLKRLLRYSLPLVPNSIGWWVVASSDRYIISGFIGFAANGIYAIAGKFSQILTLITNVFQLAWQESAIIENDTEGRDKFYSYTFNTYMKLLMGGYLAILPFIRIIFPVLTEESFHSGYLYNPILLIGAIFAAFSQFYGSAYLVFKKTGGAFTTTVVAAIINLAIGIGFVKMIGLYAPALGTAIAFLVQWLLRVHQMKGYFKVKIETEYLVVLFVLMCVVTLIYYCANLIMQYITMIAGSMVFVYFNRKMIVSAIQSVSSRNRK